LYWDSLILLSNYYFHIWYSKVDPSTGDPSKAKKRNLYARFQVGLRKLAKHKIAGIPAIFVLLIALVILVFILVGIIAAMSAAGSKSAAKAGTILSMFYNPFLWAIHQVPFLGGFIVPKNPYRERIPGQDGEPLFQDGEVRGFQAKMGNRCFRMERWGLLIRMGRG
jgi:hypothetical protein